MVTDHKPLTILFRPNKAIPVIASGRIQSWALALMDYRYQIQFRPTKLHCYADTLSRFPLRGEEVPDNDTSVLHQLHCEELYITAKEIANSIKKNPLLAKVIRYVKSGWPSTVEEQVRSYYLHKDQLTVEQGCLLREMQVIVPPEKRKRILSLLYETKST